MLGLEILVLPMPPVRISGGSTPTIGTVSVGPSIWRLRRRTPTADAWGAGTVVYNRPGMSTLINPFTPFDPPLVAAFEANFQAALSEDIGSGDVTGKLVPEHEWVRARVIVREDAVLCGAPWFEGVGNHRSIGSALCHLDGGQGFRQGANLVDLD